MDRRELKELRKRKGLNQTEMADYLGTSKTTICNVELGDKNITEKLLSNIHDVEILPDYHKVEKIYNPMTIYHVEESYKKKLAALRKKFNCKDNSVMMHKLIDIAELGSANGDSNPVLKDDSKVIADLIYKTDSDDRGNLLLSVSEDLKKTHTNYTAAIIKGAAIRYGFDE